MKNDRFYARLSEQNLSPLWEVLHNLVPLEPASDCLAAHWKYDEIRPLLMESGGLLTAEEAIRRVLIFENPGLNNHQITTSLYAGLQLILPGEIAPAHRHTQSALRFIVEGSGAYTSVDGEKTLMEVGDFVITPSWGWHDHGNDGDNAMVWLDGLDIPLIKIFEATFAENYETAQFPQTKPSGDSPARYGSGMLPVDFERKGPNSPVFNYPYGRSREALETMRQRQQWDPCHGLKMQYVNPVDGRSAMATIGSFLQLLPKGFRGKNYRSTDATIFSVVEGRGRAYIGDDIFNWTAKDTFIIPGWASYRFETDEDAVLFSFSDTPLQKFNIFCRSGGFII